MYINEQYVKMYERCYVCILVIEEEEKRHHNKIIDGQILVEKYAYYIRAQSLLCLPNICMKDQHHFLSFDFS